MSSFLRYLQVFLRIGRRRLIAAGAAGALSATIILLAAHGRAGSLNIDATFSLADNIILYFGGNSPYIRRPGLPFTPSVEWLLTLALLLSLQADIPLKNLSGIGKDILARGKSRPAWWGAASAWTLICASVFLGGAFLACLAITGITGGPISFLSHGDAFRAIPVSAEVPQDAMNILPHLMGALASLASISVIQLTLALAVSPTISFAGCIICGIGSLHSNNIAMLLCPAISARWIEPEMTAHYQAFILASLLALLGSWVLGALLIKNHDFIEDGKGVSRT